ncbi:sensor histidine kinase [Ornithinibacillus halotolerans]|uniref:Signal transduction histidine-protein kinase/phosphatase DegS n=1 Tax=Ornithinibacillus halotolerans TaxID=1274357 RepID=A0A916W563_9BACI|nr:sensor histidine kinase [Ornithinibacillus halotolerans]GGA67117.1 signal transduction histidine-protein kinase/phosphatase DegS [Ornithinibacillus halotolerans]
MSVKTREKDLDFILDEMVEVVENSKDEIFHIGEEARSEYEILLRELEYTKQKVLEYIEDGDKLEQNVRYSRKRLSEVSKYFDRYSEKEIREIYESTHELQTKLVILRQEERALRYKRDDIERRLKNLDQTVKRAENLANKISVILTYLTDDFRQVNDMIEEAKEKQEFGLKIIEAQEEERKRISREIHDGPAQMLANILLRSELVDRTFREGSPEDALEEIRNVRKMVRSSLYEVRRIIYDLRPMALDDLGLIPTIKKYASTTSDYHNVNIEFTSMGELDRINQRYEIALFRLAQEAIQNAIKHAEATLITVNLEICPKNINLVIKDNGKGFDPTIKRDKSFGLMGMRERVEMFDGIMDIKSSIGKGTKVIIQVPYERALVE